MPNRARRFERLPILQGTDVKGRKIHVYVHPQLNEMDEGFAILVTREGDDAEGEDTFPVDLQADAEQAKIIFGMLASRLGIEYRGPRLVD